MLRTSWTEKNVENIMDREKNVENGQRRKHVKGLGWSVQSLCAKNKSTMF